MSIDGKVIRQHYPIENLDKDVFIERVVKGFGRSLEFSKLHSGGILSREEIASLQRHFRDLGIPEENLTVSQMHAYALAIMKRAVARF